MPAEEKKPLETLRAFVIPECNSTLLVFPELSDKEKTIATPARTLLIDCGEPNHCTKSEKERWGIDLVNLLLKHLPVVVPGTRTIDDIIISEPSSRACGLLGEVMKAFEFGSLHHAGNTGDYDGNRVGESTAQWFRMQQRNRLHAFSARSYNLVNPEKFLNRGKAASVYIAAANIGAVKNSRGLRAAPSGVIVIVNYGSTQFIIVGQSDLYALTDFKRAYTSAVATSDKLTSGITSRIIVGRLAGPPLDSADPWPWSVEKIPGEDAKGAYSTWVEVPVGFSAGVDLEAQESGAYTMRQFRRNGPHPMAGDIIFGDPKEFTQGVSVSKPQ